MREREAEEVSANSRAAVTLTGPVPVAEMMGSIDPEGPGRETDEVTEEGDPT